MNKSNQGLLQKAIQFSLPFEESKTVKRVALKLEWGAIKLYSVRTVNPEK